MKNRGCYIDEVTTVDSSWTYEQTSAKIAQWFPQVFQHVHDKGYDRQRNEAGDIIPWWRLLAKSSYSLTVVEATHPTGANLFQNKGRDKAGIPDSQLWFGTSYLPRYLYIYTDL